MEWSEGRELQCMIESALSRIVSDCSLLIVCLMSHGCRGVLSGSDGEEIPVNDILHQFTYTLPDYLPMVCLILLYMYSGGQVVPILVFFFKIT